MRRVDAGELRSFATEIIAALGSPSDIADAVADSLVSSDLHGHGSHGTRRLATLYPEMIAEGDLDPTARATVEREWATAAIVDAGRGWGHVAGRRGVEIGVEKAGAEGTATIGVRNASHMGRIGDFAERAADAGMLFVAYVNTGGRAPMAAAPGTADRNLSVNPIAMGVPTFGALDFPIVLDFATGQVAHGKIMERAVAGEPLPSDWAIGDDGEPLADADAFEAGEGAILPLGGRAFGYKGAALSIMVDLFAGMVADASVHGQEPTGRVNNAASFFVVDPERFAPRDRQRARAEALAAYLRSLEYRGDVPTGETMKGDHAMLPGEPDHETARERRESGIPFDEGAIEALTGIADDLGVTERPEGFG